MSSSVTSTTTTSTPAGSPGQASVGLMGAFTPILLMIVFFYFLIIRPQQKREVKRKSLIDSIKKGDRVVTSCGIVGVIHKIVSSDEVSLEVAENVRIRILKNSISSILDKKSNLGKAESNGGPNEKSESKKRLPKGRINPQESTNDEKVEN